MSMHADEELDEVVVPVKRSNNEGLPSAETVEGRTSPKGNGGQTAAARTLSRDTASNGLAAVREAARQGKSVRFTALLHHITTDLLKRSYLALARDAAPGIDGVTWQTYGETLEGKLKDLHERVHRGSYRARPARRTYIPKADGTERPLSILCLEDKIVQQAVVSRLGGHLRGGFPWLLLWVPSGARPARCAGRSPCGDLSETSELGARCGYPGLFRCHGPLMDHPFPRTPGVPRPALRAEARMRRQAGDPGARQWPEGHGA